VEITAALLAGFACGYAVRELVSRQRRAAEKRRYLERQAVAKRQLLQKMISARQANDPQQSWGFEGEPPEAVIKDSGTRDVTL
jgi:hypothetical protein